MTGPVPLRRLDLTIKPDPARVLVRPFVPVGEAGGVPRVHKILARVLALGDEEVSAILDEVYADFGTRHLELQRILLLHFDRVRHELPTDAELSAERRALIGAYFTNEYSLESAALFNPSIVPHPDQTGTPRDALRIILSLRATGEGHISSITFRSGLVHADGRVEIDPPSRLVTEPRPNPDAEFDQALFLRKLAELNLDNAYSRRILDTLDAQFTLDELDAAVRAARRSHPAPDAAAIGERLLVLAKSNYEVDFDPKQDVSERIIFPFSPSQSNGIEDARFVRFVEDDGAATYVATYTAYDGRVILPQIMETRDFLHFKVCTLNGPAIRNKGLALFPRRIGGLYCMLSRQDNENIHLMFSDHLHFWTESQVIMRPTAPWEFIQLGNCGAPIETEAGWLVLTHGVGPMRKYCISAILLDRHDPARIIGRLREPLIHPSPEEREGYVPNVVYTCGALVHRGHLILPYAISDSSTVFATVPLDLLLAALLHNPA
jgi:predicted GH43/DUF377 family glycosyl hydrolase